MKTLIAIITISLYSAAQGRIGETEKECVARYGEPVSQWNRDGDRGMIFTKNGFRVFAHFFDGKCDSLLIRKDSEGEKRLSMSLDEVLAFLLINSANEKWLKSEIEWACPTRKLFAFADPAREQLQIETLGHKNRQAAKENGVAFPPSVKGF